MLAPVSALDDGVGTVNDRISDGSRSDPGFAIELDVSLVHVDVLIDIGGGDRINCVLSAPGPELSHTSGECYITCVLRYIRREA